MSGSYKPGGYTSVSPIAEKRLTDYRTPIGETLKRPRVWMNVLLFFLMLAPKAGLAPAIVGFAEAARNRFALTPNV